MILSTTQAEAVIRKALSFASADEVHVQLSGSRKGNTRFALNSVTSSADVDTLEVAVTAYFGKRHAAAAVTEIDEASLRRVVSMAEELARVAPEDPEYVPLLGPQEYLPIDPYFDGTARATPELRAKATRSAIGAASRKRLVAAGFFEHEHGFTAIGNNKGLFAYSRATDASFTMTTRSGDGTRSGWASDNSRNIDEIDYRGAAERAAHKAEASRKPEALEPGVYPVILEPHAAAEFLQFAVYTMNARSADEGRSFYAKPGGGNKIGEKVVGENVTLLSDPSRPDVLGQPFASDGLPAKKHVWIENGVLRQLFYDRYWAQKQSKEPTGYPANLIFQGGEGTVDDLVKATDRAVLVTRFWYIRFVDPQTILVTGLTRDGTFWVENGEIRHALRNFRFNESPIAVLNRVTGMSRPVRVGESLVPAVRASAFAFSSISESV